MGKKFCPQCNRNVSVARINGHKCCSCCGFNADYMGPAVSEQYSASRPPSQSQNMVKPDEHGHDDRTFGRYTAQADIGSKTEQYRIFAMAAIIVSLGLAFAGMFVDEYIWLFDDGTEVTGIMFTTFVDNGWGVAMIAFMIAALVSAVTAPKMLAVVYLVIGFSNLMISGEVQLLGYCGIYALIVSVFVLVLMARWEKATGIGSVAPKDTIEKFWKNRY